MNKEIDICDALELQESLSAYDYFVRKGIGAGVIFNRDNHKVEISDILEDGDFVQHADALAHGVIATCFPSAPAGNLIENARKLFESFNTIKNNLMLNMNSSVDTYSEEEIEAVEAFNFDEVVSFANKKFIEYLQKPVDCRLSAERVYKRDSMALYWLRVRTVAVAAFSISG